MARQKATASEATPEVTVTPALELTQAEIEAIIAARSKVGSGEAKVGVSELAQALITAIEATRPPTKKTPFNRKKGDPWQNPDGSPKPKLKRKMYHHGMDLLEEQLFSEQINLLNKIKAGRYCDNLIRVIKRKDGGLDIDYPVKTASQRLKVVSAYGGGNFTKLLERLIAERADPAKYRKPGDDEDDE